MATALDEQQIPAVDETPISPVRSAGQRKKSLQHHLETRPDRSVLIDRNILPESTDPPALQEKENAKHKRAETLNDKISHRPSPEQLIKEGVLHDDPRSAEEKYAEAMEEEYAKREGGA